MFRVSVETAVTRCPPHRPVLALLVHTVPTLDVWRRSARWDKDVRFGRKESGQQVAPESAPRPNGSVDSADEGGAAITAARLSERSQCLQVVVEVDWPIFPHFSVAAR